MSCFRSVHPWLVVMTQTNDKVAARSKFSTDNRVGHAVCRETMGENDWLQFFERGNFCISKHGNWNHLHRLRSQKQRKLSKKWIVWLYHFMKSLSFLVSPGHERHSQSTRVVIHRWVKNWALVSHLFCNEIPVANPVGSAWNVKAEWHIIILVPQEKRKKESCVEYASKIMKSKHPADQLPNDKCQHEWQLCQSETFIPRSNYNQHCDAVFDEGYHHSFRPV